MGGPRTPATAEQGVLCGNEVFQHRAGLELLPVLGRVLGPLWLLLESHLLELGARPAWFSVSSALGYGVPCQAQPSQAWNLSLDGPLPESLEPLSSAQLQPSFQAHLFLCLCPQYPGVPQERGHI